MTAERNCPEGEPCLQNAGTAFRGESVISPHSSFASMGAEKPTSSTGGSASCRVGRCLRPRAARARNRWSRCPPVRDCAGAMPKRRENDVAFWHGEFHVLKSYSRILPTGNARRTPPICTRNRHPSTHRFCKCRSIVVDTCGTDNNRRLPRLVRIHLQ